MYRGGLPTRNSSRLALCVSLHFLRRFYVDLHFLIVIKFFGRRVEMNNKSFYDEGFFYFVCFWINSLNFLFIA